MINEQVSLSVEPTENNALNSGYVDYHERVFDSKRKNATTNGSILELSNIIRLFGIIDSLLMLSRVGGVTTLHTQSSQSNLLAACSHIAVFPSPIASRHIKLPRHECNKISSLTD